MQIKDVLKNIEFNLDSIYEWGKNLSERTLSLSAIVILYLAFIPDLVAYMNALTDKLPSLNSYIIVTAALVILNLRAIFKNDSIACLIHMIGFVSQIFITMLILLK